MARLTSKTLPGRRNTQSWLEIGASLALRHHHHNQQRQRPLDQLAPALIPNPWPSLLLDSFRSYRCTSVPCTHASIVDCRPLQRLAFSEVLPKALPCTRGMARPCVNAHQLVLQHRCPSRSCSDCQASVSCRNAPPSHTAQCSLRPCQSDRQPNPRRPSLLGGPRPGSLKQTDIRVTSLGASTASRRFICLPSRQRKRFCG